MLETLAGPLILIAVLVGVIWRPRILGFSNGVPVFIPAGIGAILLVVSGLVGLPTLETIFGRVWDASFTLVGLFMLAAALEANHFFEWAALSLAQVAKGSPWRLYMLMCLLTIGVTVFLGNDGAILGMTAIVAKLVKRTFPENMRVWWPYIFVAGFLADAFSGFLVPDNLTNIIVASTYHLPFILFLLQMSLPMILAATVAIVCFAIRYSSVLFKEKISYNPANLQGAASVLKDRLIFKVSWGVLFVLIAGHLIIGGVFHQPVTFVVLPMAVIMLGFVHFRRLRSAREVLVDAPWDVLVYALGMFVVITAAMTPGVTARFLSIAPLHGLIAGTERSLTGLFVTGGLLATLAGLTNNLPATLAGVVLLGAGSAKHRAPAMLAVYAVILGVDIGPKLTPYGSLATLMWMGILKRQGIRISWGLCFKENWWVAVFSLGAALFGLFVLLTVGLV